MTRKRGKRRSGYSRPLLVDADSLAHIRIAIRIPAELKARFDAACQERGVTMSKVVRMIAEMWIAEGEKRAAE